MHGSLVERLAELRDESPAQASDSSELRRWGRDHLSLDGAALDAWTARAWWGLAAGELVRSGLYDPATHDEAMSLVTSTAGLDAVEAANRKGGVVVVGAHLGPPKLAMRWTVVRQWPMLLWTNQRGMPEWFVHTATSSAINPVDVRVRHVVLPRSAAHLRSGGIVLGAPDVATGRRRVVLERLGTRWELSLGLPTLVRRFSVSAFVVMARWRGERLHLSAEAIEPPSDELDGEEWCRAWLERLWADHLAPVITSSPEDLRFLRRVDRRFAGARR